MYAIIVATILAAGAAAHAPPARLCRAGMEGASCFPVEDAEQLLERDDLEIVAAAAPPSGKQGVRVLTLRAGAVVFRAKWRPQAAATRRNSPRFELAAYEVQKLFVSPRDYVVPPAAAHCFPLAAYRASVDRKATSTFRDVDCVFGILSYWLENVQTLADASEAGTFRGAYGGAFDPTLFARDKGYRDSAAHVNLLTYLIGHGDTHLKNFVITRDPRSPALYSVDNSLSLGMRKNSKLSPIHDWSKMRVPAVPYAAIQRLRAADGRLASLAALAYLEIDDGRLVLTKGGAPTPTAQGFNWDGGRLRYGLTIDELAYIQRRITEILAKVDSGKLRVYRARRSP
jgi:hypothetical protein